MLVWGSVGGMHGPKVSGLKKRAEVLAYCGGEGRTGPTSNTIVVSILVSIIPI